MQVTFIFLFGAIRSLFFAILFSQILSRFQFYVSVPIYSPPPLKDSKSNGRIGISAIENQSGEKLRTLTFYEITYARWNNVFSNYSGLCYVSFDYCKMFCQQCLRFNHPCKKGSQGMWSLRTKSMPYPRLSLLTNLKFFQFLWMIS